MDGQEDREEEMRRGRAERGVIQEESAAYGLIRARSFVSGLIFSSEVVSWPPLCSPRQSVGLSHLFRPATLINFFPEIIASSEESARHEKTLRKTFQSVSKMAKTAPSAAA